MSQRYKTGAKRARAPAALALTLGCAFAHLTAAQNGGATNALPLRAGETQRATQRASDRVSFVIDLEARGDYLLRVDQGGLDLVVTLTEPGGHSESFNSPLLRNEAELVLLADRPTGRYEVALRTDEHSETVATPAVELIALASSGDSREREALQAMTRGAAANFAGGDEAWRSAVTEYERAAELWRDLGRRREEAQALFAIAMVEFWQLYAWQRSADLAGRAATLYAALDEPSLAASAIELRGSALVEQALEAGETEPAEAETLFTRAVALFEEARLAQERVGNQFALGSVLNYLGYVAYNRGEHEASRHYRQQSAAVLAAAGEPGAELLPLANLAALDVEAGRVATAVDTLERILAVLPPGKLERYRSDTLFNLGTSYRMLGYTDQALQTFATALAIQVRDEDKQGRGRSLRGVGETYYALGELETATQYLEQALVLAVETNDGRPQGAIHRTLGDIASLEGNHTKALERHQTALRFATSATDRAYLELLIARDLINLGRAAEAAELARAASATAETAGSDLLTAASLHELGRAEATQEPALASGAAAKLERAADLYAKLGLDAEHAAALHSLSITARDRGDLSAARTYGAEAIAAAEKLRLRMADPELRAAAAANHRSYYETQIDTLIRLHTEQNGGDAELRAAFGFAERSRARMLADLLAEAAVDLRGTLAPAIRARETALVESFAERRIERDRLLQQPADDVVRAQISVLTGELAARENELNLLEIEMRRADPRRGALTSGTAVTSEQAQAMLDDGTVLLEYALGTPASYVFVVSRERIAAVTLANRATIEAAARDALAGLATPAPNGAAPGLAALAKLVLAPVAPYLDKPRVLLALDGALQYVPFAALPSPTAEDPASRLIAAHDIVVVPSLTAVAALPVREAERPKTLVIVADPVLTASDPRLRAAPAVLSAAAAPATLLERSSVGPRLERLLATSYEADALAALVPPDQRLVARGFQANREAILGAPLEQYRYVHFATHGLVDARYPGLSALALSQFDEQGGARNGFLRLHDIYNLRLDAEVAVLSACETALGRDIRGEGLVGLTQGFMYAGARSVVASLWQAPDRATAELMTRFYRHLLQGELRPAAALRRAQTELAAERRFADPYFWSGFVLIGDWR